MTVQSWLAAAVADAERRGLHDLKPLLEALSRSTDSLRKADADVAQRESGDEDATP